MYLLLYWIFYTPKVTWTSCYKEERLFLFLVYGRPVFWPHVKLIHCAWRLTSPCHGPLTRCTWYFVPVHSPAVFVKGVRAHPEQLQAGLPCEADHLEWCAIPIQASFRFVFEHMDNFHCKRETVQLTRGLESYSWQNWTYSQVLVVLSILLSTCHLLLHPLKETIILFVIKLNILKP